jgi:hypothetical protein
MSVTINNNLLWTWRYSSLTRLQYRAKIILHTSVIRASLKIPNCSLGFISKKNLKELLISKSVCWLKQIVIKQVLINCHTRLTADRNILLQKVYTIDGSTVDLQKMNFLPFFKSYWKVNSKVYKGKKLMYCLLSEFSLQMVSKH